MDWRKEKEADKERKQLGKKQSKIRKIGKKRRGRKIRMRKNEIRQRMIYLKWIRIVQGL
jgi:hypothetical protein